MLIFCLGLPKTGAATLHKAMSVAGLVSRLATHDGKYIGRLLYQGRDAGDALARFKGVDVLACTHVCLPDRGLNHWPQLDFDLIEHVRARHPRTKFLLPVRDVDAVARSMAADGALVERLIPADVPGLPRGAGAVLDELEQWVAWHYRRVRALFSGDRQFLELPLDGRYPNRRIAKWINVTLPWWGVDTATGEGP